MNLWQTILIFPKVNDIDYLVKIIMRILFPLLLFFTGIHFSVAFHFRTLKDTFSKCYTLSSIDTTLKKYFNSFKIGSSNYIINRKLDFGYRQIILEFEVEFGSNNVQDFRICILADSQDSIVLGVIQLLMDNEKPLRSKRFNFNKRKVTAYKRQHNSLYQYRISKNKFQKQITKQRVFGFGCGYTGKYNPPEALKMMKCVKRGRYKQLSKFLRQLNPELQAYGVLGLIELNRNGITITLSDSIIIEHLKTRNTEVNYCSGCIFGRSITITEILK